ncbi:Glyoxalase/Bleomycin resistance protein/Dihydroxybiphenyl dioxygenase [Acaromyces ingoldii]|uniref:Glyoxalase/Bleomycin resistance protein/Dihydroxybiphenyl dioxygenase n=1 Tax=Acaromyces ingoldii TaxID=215250 RepID=A0A316YBZ5_9BASI|nr:Glyoxalase/Bleomycin resistance protein/Dihydroxybiphenyl dioxygenase [Acaromyces ingoldii]PWN86769.1 Glyoxalase/Bleomycin resistance protein/Dihydroxybiphenyl dioxygenase [Acaromyces ingoldii]
MIDDRRVHLVRIAHIHYRHHDLAKATQFLEDFGMTQVSTVDNRRYFRGYGELPFIYVAEQTETERAEFVRVAFEAKDESSLKRASELPGATPIMELQSPGGGRGTSLRDPSGIQIDVILGQQYVPVELPRKRTQAFNRGGPSAEEKPRAAGNFQRFNREEVVRVHKLGHFVLQVADYASSRKFYTETLNFAPSDILQIGEMEAGAFLHLDLGTRSTDHHTLFLQALPPGAHGPCIHHSAYEVYDIDQEFLAHQQLQSKGYELAWGIGRHILGSQLFDYWHQTSDNFNLEHYADGDLVNAATPVGRHQITPGAPVEQELSVWGPAFGKSFLSSGEISLQ